MATTVSGFRFRTFHFAILASAVAALAVFMVPDRFLESQRELYFDVLTQISEAPASDQIVVVDIDRAALEATGSGLWQRSDTASVIRRIAAAKPAVIALDLVFSKDCDVDEPGNQALSEALAQAPSVLGFLISEQGSALPQPRPPMAYSKSVHIPTLWFIDGTEQSCDQFQASAASSGASFLVGDEDSRVRRVQAFSIFQNYPYPALSLETVRLFRDAQAPVILSGEPLWLKMPGLAISLAEGGSIRFTASDSERVLARTTSAANILSEDADLSALEGKIVFFGSSLPNFGGLRASASMPLEPSVQIHADIANNLLTGFVPTRYPDFIRFEALYVLLAGVCLSVAANRLRPQGIALFGAGTILLSLLLTVLIYQFTAFLFDGFSVGLALLLVLVFTSFIQFAHVRRIESVARQRFGQYLPKSVVARYLDNPDMVRMQGEERQVTALFTDIEGFSALAQKVGPREMISMLDIYFSEVTRLIADSGGMVDKIVGDAVHALFNAPEDLDNHVNRAIDCSLKIISLTEEMRQRPNFKESGFGRTRIGIETGMVVFGEVGSGGKLDFTAHGEAINLAGRLQEANKFLGTSICVGPTAASETNHHLRSVGVHMIRSNGEIELFSP